MSSVMAQVGVHAGSAQHQRPDLPLEISLGGGLKEMADFLMLNLYCPASNKDIRGKFLNVRSKILSPQATQGWFIIHVELEGRNKFPCEISQFLKDHSKHLVKIVEAMSKCFPGDFLMVYTPRSNTSEGRVDGVHCVQNETETEFVVTTLTQLQPSKNPALQLRAFVNTPYGRAEVHRYSMYLKNLQIFHPEVKFQFSYNFDGHYVEDSCRNAGEEIHLSTKRMVKNTSFFIDNIFGVDGIPPMVYVRSSNSTSLTLNLTRHGNAKRVKLTCVAQVVPGVDTNDYTKHDDSDVPDINRLCTHVKIIFVGPHDIPIYWPNTCPDPRLGAEILDLKDYGLKLGELVKNDVMTAPIQGDCCYSLISVLEDTAQSFGPTEDDDSAPTEEMTLIIYLMFNLVQHDGALNCFDILDNLKVCLPQIIRGNPAKIKTVFSSAVNKVFRNYGQVDQRQTLYQAAIDSMSEDVSVILKHSTNERFRQACLKSLKQANVDDFRTAMTDRLWSIMGKSLHVYPPRAILARTEKNGRSAGKKSAAKITSQSKAISPGDDSQRSDTSLSGSTSNEEVNKIIDYFIAVKNGPQGSMPEDLKSLEPENLNMDDDTYQHLLADVLGSDPSSFDDLLI